MKYGEKFYTNRWLLSRKFVSYKFRCEPVPFIHKRVRSGFKNWYKTPRVMNEKRQSFTEFCRAKRNVRNLPNPWDDYRRSDTFDKGSWKKNCKCHKQWQKNKRR